MIRIAALTLLMVLSQASTVSSDKDTKIGDAMFRISKQGSDIVMEPLLVPHFRLTLLKGPGIEANDIQKCVVLRRDSAIDTNKDIIYTVVVLRCGENEYAVAEVDFRYETETQGQIDLPLIKGSVPQPGRSHETGKGPAR